MNGQVMVVFALLLLLLTSAQSRSHFRFAMAFNGQSAVLGFRYHQNLGRINLQKYLTAKYPDMVSEHTFAMITPSYTTYCDPQFEAWAAAGYDVIIGILGHQLCLVKLAAVYPNTTFLVFAGSATGPSNYANLWVREYQPVYLAGLTAGLVTKAKKLCVAAGLRAPASVIDVAAFCRGAHAANPAAEIHIMETGAVSNVLLETWVVNQSYAMGCDAVFLNSVNPDGLEQADKLGMMSIGLFSDARLTVGESVITSVYLNFTPMLVRPAEAILNGTFFNETQKADWWMGWDWGAMLLADFSFLVPANVSARVLAQTANVSRVFCGRVCTATGCLCNSSACCLTDSQLNSMVTYPDFVIEHGLAKVPGQACKAGQLGTFHLDTFTVTCSDCPAGTYAYNADQLSECRPCPAATYSAAGSTNCTTCPAGTYNDQQGQGQCPPCPRGTIAANTGSSKCNACPSGLTSDDATQCASASLVWLAGVGGGIGAVFILIGLWAWLANRRMRELRKQFSNDNVAVECAAAIARLDLQAVVWLSDIPKPNRIQSSFIRIVMILSEVRKYVPDQLLQTLAGNDEAAAGGRLANKDDGDSEDELGDLKLRNNPSQQSLHKGVPPGSSNPPTSSCGSATRPSISSSKNHGPGQPHAWALRKVTYLLVRYAMDQHHSTPGQAGENMTAFLSHLVETAKANNGTLGTVGYDRAVVHWGTTKRTMSEAPVKAVETALALTKFSAKLRGGAELDLAIVIGCENAIVGVVETATNSFFMVGGGPVLFAERLFAKDWTATLGVRILIADAVRESVQYAYLCHPRLVDDKQVVWEPLGRSRDQAENEWMYQLRESEATDALSLNVLLSPFKAACKGNGVLAQTLARDIRAKHHHQLSPADLAALDWVANHAGL